MKDTPFKKAIKQLQDNLSLNNKIAVLSVLPYRGEPGKTRKKIEIDLFYRFSKEQISRILEILNKKPHKYAICIRHTKRWRQTKLGHEFLEKNRS